jgi:C-terminal processing protease CtpA/Prc
VHDACFKQVGGKDVAGIDKIEDVHKLLNGPVGSKVRLKLSRSGMLLREPRQD